jgi:hypothetical protein
LLGGGLGGGKWCVTVGGKTPKAESAEIEHWTWSSPPAFAENDEVAEMLDETPRWASAVAENDEVAEMLDETPRWASAVAEKVAVTATVTAAMNAAFTDAEIEESAVIEQVAAWSAMGGYLPWLTAR